MIAVAVPLRTFVSYEVTAGSLHLLDPERRTYMIRRRTAEAWHLIAPADAEHPLVLDPDKPVVTGDLICTCPGGRFRGRCWALTVAGIHETRSRPDAEPVSWFGESPS